MPFSALFSIRPWRAGFMALAALGAIVTGASPAMAAGDATSAPVGCLGTASKTWLKIVTEGVRSSSGQIAITIYPDDPSRFLIHHGSLFVDRSNAAAGTTNSCVFLPRPGVYVVAIYHDENGNGSFDRNSLGLPTEAFGFSNNPPTLLGLPSFRSVRLDVAHSGLTAHIKLTYP